MAGHITKRTIADGTAKGRTRWRARHPDPLRGGTAQIERVFDTRKAAEDWLAALRPSVSSGQYLDPVGGRMALADLAAEWRTTWRRLEPKTKAGYESILNRHYLGDGCRFAQAELVALTPDVVQRFVNDLSATHAPATVRRVYGVLRQMFALAVKRRYVAESPCDAVDVGEERAARGADGLLQKPRIYLTDAEVRTLAEAMPPRWRVAVYVSAYCGLRAGEQWALRRRDVDLVKGELHVERALKDINSTSTALADDEKGLIFGPTKTHATRVLALPGFIRDMLREHLAAPSAGGVGPDDLLFTSRHGHPVRHSLFYARVFRPVAMRTLPMEKRACRWHDLRHTCASLSLAVSPNLHIVKERLGHTDIKTTINVYGHLLPSVDQALAEGLGAGYAAAEEASNVVQLRAVT